MEISALQKERAGYQPKLPKALQGAVKVQEGAPTQSVDNQEDIKKLFPNTYGMPLVEFVPADSANNAKINVGIILSGGQAPGGHNVISGLFDEVKKLNPENRLYGFLMGPGGLVDHNYIEITAENLQAYRNTGGFDMIGSGRTKLEKEEQFEKGLEILRKLDIKAVVIIGGDDSNTNACVLAEYYAAKQYGVQVIGCPKTIDGDLKNDQIETSFGFDTATKTYSELIGNIERDCNSARKYWHFIKLMGRSASHIALECALQTQPNICLVSEEIESKDQTLNDIVEYIAGVVAYRAEQGNNFGVVLIPEGLIEFIPAIGRLIQELNDLLAAHGADYLNLDKDAQRKYILEHLSAENKATFETLPEGVARQLSLDRDPHGNVQVSLIETEKLISEMVAAKLDQWKKEGKYAGKFSPLHHFFGYEGRCAAPSNFDADYCYALGSSAAQLIANGKTGYMAIVKNTTAPADQWKAGGVPITMMMNMERRNGEMKPVIRKALVELDGAPFKTFAAQREKWAKETCYVYPGPIQYWGPSSVCDQTTKTLELEQAK
ncbi:diphosphate--fructose-6-phosphate 1-phosphotransferase [Prevotella melaninogenica]|jgi:diphosphate--fructose-6-phosphate 1-phosphotransferase|uniref:diphosphate--fructose-6-phosphate 1-phosphotransferase n=2 Tax=Prevotella TaxID=838 RepID=UPI0001AEB395|nr:MULTISPECIES: diphosphate--fructose-6-phosphate 1-phosphotransferase [Prevotella]ADK97073.1 diphosphate--fructose-6-phosphate 1-phosphotransferase [Prevotella melaninogenica ATCC 25845]ASE18732.1 diphosphate--fructose-6-phosphate 1-phosphotransferase [Prevotella melaninogenica]MBF1588607.1 diphosphate--fructose-6-phosphate 1-phosphotransferase [Prevotella sp.]MBF1592946.1 diphosphate--fructose-6-phosphate 1-phosphotransferase [Prevotella sp.]MBF1606939.1 diphosphate--fructose-6-phosphate 1-